MFRMSGCFPVPSFLSPVSMQSLTERTKQSGFTETVIVTPKRREQEMGIVQQMKSHPKRGLTFLALVPGILISGISMAIIGPTLLDLETQVGTTTRGIAFVLTSRAVGSVIGTIACGLFGPRIDLLLVTGIANLVGALCTASYAFLTQVYLLMGVSVTYGLYSGFYLASQMALVTRLWGQEASPFQQVVCFLFSMGQVLAPVIAAPFLSEPRDDRESRIYIPYTLIAGSMVANAVLVIATWFCVSDSSEHPSRVRDEEKASSSGQRNGSWCCWQNAVILCFAIGVHINSGVEIVMAQFLTTFAHTSSLHLPKVTGAHMTTMSYSLFAVKNLLAIVYVPVIGDRANIVLSSCTVLSGSLFLMFLGQESEVNLWIGAAVVAFGDGGIYASTLGFMEGRFPVSTTVSSIMTFAYVSGEFTIPALVSFVIEDEPQMLMVMTFACSLTMLSFFLVVNVICFFHRNRETASRE